MFFKNNNWHLALVPLNYIRLRIKPWECLSPFCNVHVLGILLRYHVAKTLNKLFIHIILPLLKYFKEKKM